MKPCYKNLPAYLADVSQFVLGKVRSRFYKGGYCSEARTLALLHDVWAALSLRELCDQSPEPPSPFPNFSRSLCVEWANRGGTVSHLGRVYVFSLSGRDVFSLLVSSRGALAVKGLCADLPHLFVYVGNSSPLQVLQLVDSWHASARDLFLSPVFQEVRDYILSERVRLACIHSVLKQAFASTPFRRVRFCESHIVVRLRKGLSVGVVFNLRHLGTIQRPNSCLKVIAYYLSKFSCLLEYAEDGSPRPFSVTVVASRRHLVNNAFSVNISGHNLAVVVPFDDVRSVDNSFASVVYSLFMKLEQLLVPLAFEHRVFVP